MDITTDAPELARVRDFLADQTDITLAVVFGSMARGEASEDSDLDLAVYADSGPLTARRKFALISGLGAITGRPVDLVDLRNADVLIRREALTNGKRLLARNTHVHGDELSRMVMDAEDFLPYLERSMRQRRERWIG
jgi:predicted nucleotidyltransferase